MPTKLEPVEGMLAVIHDGSSTGTNKYALLLALIDLAPEMGREEALSIDDIAAKLIELHWDHAREYDDGPLRQVTSGNRANTTAVLEVIRLHERLAQSGETVPPFERARPLIEEVEWRRSVRTVATATAKNPLRYLQTINRSEVRFLYEPVTDRTVRFLPGAIEALVRYGPVLRDLIEFRYVRFVVAANRKPLGPSVEEQVAEHLFGRSRHMPPPSMRHELWELQGRRCLYSGAKVTDPATPSGSASLDHVVPWSRVRVSAVENFVLTTRSVNSAKSNLLLAPDLFERWADHVTANADDLRSIAADHGWPTDLGRVTQVAAGLYRQTSPSGAVWNGKGMVDALGQSGQDRVLKRLHDLAPTVQP